MLLYVLSYIKFLPLILSTLLRLSLFYLGTLLT